MKLVNRLAAAWRAAVHYQAAPALPAVESAPAPAPAPPGPPNPVSRQVLDGNGMLIPQYRTFNALYNTFSRMHSHRFDEAIRDAQANADEMERDAFVWSLIQERVLPLTRWKWEVQADQDSFPPDRPNGSGMLTAGPAAGVPGQALASPTNPKDPYSTDREAVRDQITACVRKTHDLLQVRFYLGQALFYGRYGSQCRWDPAQIGGFQRRVVGYSEPVHGDKIRYTWDGVPGVLIFAGDRQKYPDVRIFDAMGPICILSRPDMRERFVIHKHFRLDAPYHDYLAAGRVQGLGYRDFMYWNWWLRREMITWMTDFLEKVGSLGILVFFYDQHNATAKAKAEAAAQKTGNQNALAVPVPSTDPRVGSIELIPANVTGAEFLVECISDWFERHLERLWVGQSMSAGSDNESGLGGTGRAEFAKDTKHNLLSFDAENQAETFTNDLVAPIMRFNFRGAPGAYRFVYRIPDPAAQEKLQAVQGLLQFLPFVADDLYDLAGVRKPNPGDTTVGGPQMGAGGPGMPGLGPDGGGPGGPGDGSPSPGMGPVVAAMMRAASQGDQR